MPISDAYATPTLYRAVKGNTDSANDTVLSDQLIAVSRYMDKRLNRFYTKDVAPVARVGIPGDDWLLKDEWTLFVADIASASGVAIKVDSDLDGSFTDEAAFAAADFQLRPSDAPYGPEPKPYTQIYLTRWGGRSQWTEGYPVEVTAIWGWPAVPKAIEQACVELTAIFRMTSPRATRRMDELGQVLSTSRPAQDIVSELMTVYGRVEF